MLANNMKTKYVLLALLSCQFSLAAAHSPIKEWFSSQAPSPQRLCPQELKQTYFYSIVNQNSPMSTAENELCLKNMLSFSSLINADLRYTDHEGAPRVLAEGHGSVWGVGTRPMFGNHSLGLYGNIKNASIFIDAKPNEWLGADLSLTYVGASSEERTYYHSGLDFNTVYDVNAGLKVDEAIITIANPAVTPFYIRLGKQYLNSFGDYKPYPITQTLTQLLTQSRTGALTGGVVLPNGFYSSASWSMAQATVPVLFRIPNDDFSLTDIRNQLPEHNYSAKIGFLKDCEDFDFNINLSYLHDIRDVDYLMGLYTFVNIALRDPAENQFVANQIFLINRAPAVAFHLEGHWKQFGFGFESAKALRNMNLRPASSSSKIFTYGINANYSFPLFICDLPSKIDLSFQHAKSADIVYPIFNASGITPGQQFIEQLIRSPVDLGGVGVPGFSFPIQISNLLPKNRFVATYTVDIWEDLFAITFQWLHDRDFPNREAGTGNSANIGTARMTMQF